MRTNAKTHMGTMTRAASERTQLRQAPRGPVLVIGALLLATIAWLLTGCGASTGTGGATSAATTCVSALPGSSPINLGSHGFVYPISYPTNTVSSSISMTASGSGLFTVNQFTACTPNSSVGATQGFYNAHLPAQHGWSAATSFPADGGLLVACAAPCFSNASSGPVYYVVIDQFTDRGAGVVTYRGRWAAFDSTSLPACGPNFGTGNTGAQQDVYFVGSGDTAFPVPPLSSIAAADASGGVRGYDVCSPGTAASVSAFLAKEVPAARWTKVTASNAHCTIASNCWSKGGQFWSWGAIGDPTLWTISYRQ
jgi:hypothetical protein